MPSTRSLAASALLVVVVLACGARESAEARVTRVRRGYRIVPAGVRPLRPPTGAAALAIDVLAVNTGRESLATLTVLVHVVGPDGRERAARRVPLDVAGLEPGVRAPLTALVPGLEPAADEVVLVELEGAPPSWALAAYPEYAAARRGGL